MGVGQGPGRYHLNTQQAFAAYEAVRHRLPPVRRVGRCRPAENLGDIAQHFDAFFLDAFGVLNIGEAAIPGAPERVARLQRQGKRVLVVTNAASLPQSGLWEKYARLGFDFAPEDIVSSRDATLKALQDQPDKLWGLMLPQGSDRSDLAHLRARDLAHDPQTYDQVEGFLLLGSSGWTVTRQTLLEAALRDRLRPVMVGNPDIVAPRENGFSLEPGFFAHGLADRTCICPRFFGKPFASVYDLARARVPEVAANRILMVGDSLHTDILGGQGAGLATALVAGWGFFAGTDVDQPILASGIHPDFILSCP